MKYQLPPMIMLSIFCVLTTQGADQKCYQCQVRDNALCNDTFLTDCPHDQSYDRCITIVKKTASDGEWIVKKCALGPCSLRDDVSNKELGLDHCDRSKAEYDCRVCCRENGCNVNQSFTLKSSIISTLAIAIILSLV
ncbi:hypothetical protein CHUAL_000664 [Chamberlinius hualienensis]